MSDEHTTSAGGLMASLCAGMFVFGIVMAILGAILPSLFATIALDKAEAGNLFLVMNFAMLIMSLAFGPVVDRFGFKVFLLACAVLVAASLLLLSTAASYPVVLAAVAVLGFAGGGINGGANALTSDLNPERRGAALNVLGTFFGFGALTMPFLIGALLEHLGLRLILTIAAVLSLVPAVMYAALRFPRPKHEQGFPLAQAAHVVGNPLLWLCAFLLFFQSANEFTVGGWISSYLSEIIGFAPAAASLVLAGYWAAMMSGRFVSSRIVGRLGNARLVLASAVLAFAAALIAAFAQSQLVACAGAILLGLGFAAIFPSTLAVVGEAFPAFTGTAFSVAFVVALSGGMTAPWLTSRIAAASSLRQGMLVPVVACAAIVILQLVIMRALRRSGQAR
jgi:FHS family glucose/mannose:H+ symporter-like MFS transporter